MKPVVETQQWVGLGELWKVDKSCSCILDQLQGSDGMQGKTYQEQDTVVVNS